MEVFRLERVDVFVEDLFFDVANEVLGEGGVDRRCLIDHSLDVDGKFSQGAVFHVRV